MALTEVVDLNIREAQRQISALESQLNQLGQPVDIPVNISGDQSVDRLRSDLARAESSTAGLNNELAETDRELDRVETSARRAGREIDDVGRRGTTSFSRLTASAVGFLGALAAFQGVQVLGRGIASAISQASDLEESLSKTSVVFGGLTSQIEDFASTAPEALGLTTAAALESTATFGNLFVALGLTQEAAADLAPDIIQLASDLASFNNIEVAEAVEKLRAGLVGEAEPLRTLGVNINAALVEAKALELGLEDVTGTVSEAAKVQARYALIFEQTATAQGDYARTADGVANTQRTLTAEFGNVSAALGEALLPAYQRLLDLAPSILSAIEGLTPVIAAAAEGMASAAPDAQSFAEGLQAIGAVPVAIGTLQGTFQGVFDVLAGGAGVLTGTVGGLDQVASGIDRIQDAALAFDLSQLRNELINQIQAGVDPVTSLANVLVDLTNLDLDATELTEAADALASIAGIDPGRAKDLAITIEDQADALGLEKDEAAALVLALRDLFEIENSRGSQSRGVGARREAAEALERQREAAERLADAAITEAEALDILEDFAGRTGQTLLSLLQNTESLPPALQGVAEAVSGTSIAFLDSVSRADEFAEAMREIPEAMADARAAFTDEAGEFEDDASEFVDRFIENLANRAAFESNLQKLRDAGGELLAAMLEAEGPEEAGDLLADFLANPEQIARGEGAAQERAMSDAAAYLEEFLNSIDAADFSVTPPNAEVVIPVLADLQPFLDSIAGLPGMVDFSVEAPVAPVTGGGGGNAAIGIQGGTTNDIDITLISTGDTATDAARAAQQISALIGPQ